MIRAIFTLILLFAALPARAAVDIQEVTSPRAITAWLVEEQAAPFVAIEIRFTGGPPLDAPVKPLPTHPTHDLPAPGAR